VTPSSGMSIFPSVRVSFPSASLYRRKTSFYSSRPGTSYVSPFNPFLDQIPDTQCLLPFSTSRYALPVLGIMPSHIPACESHRCHRQPIRFYVYCREKRRSWINLEKGENTSDDGLEVARAPDSSKRKVKDRIDTKHRVKFPHSRST
jgi:hypothetical protein